MSEQPFNFDVEVNQGDMDDLGAIGAKPFPAPGRTVPWQGKQITVTFGLSDSQVEFIVSVYGNFRLDMVIATLVARSINQMMIQRLQQDAHARNLRSLSDHEAPKEKRPDPDSTKPEKAEQPNILAKGPLEKILGYLSYDKKGEEKAH